jgi:DNA mismatch repair protein MutL
MRPARSRRWRPRAGRDLGFRGEALPSIASVSRLSLTTRTAAAEHAWAVSARDGAPAAPAPAAHPGGTSVEVRDLFLQRAGAAQVPAHRDHRVPAHRAHARAPGPVALRRRLLAAHNGKRSGRCRRRAIPERNGCARGEDLRRGIRAHVIELRHDDRERCACRGGSRCRPSRAARPICSSPSERPLRARQADRGRGAPAYQDVLFNGRFPAYVLYLELDPAQVDVNAHPQKLEVRFRESRRVHDFLFRTVERALAETRPTHESRAVRRRTG